MINELTERCFQTSNGAACTCVVTEYHWRDNDDFRVTIDKLNAQEIATQCAELLRDYRMFHLPDDTTGVDEEDKEDVRKQADVAIDTFRAMFPHGGPLTQHEYLVNEPEEDVLRHLQERAEEMQPSTISEYQVVQSLEDCCSLLNSLTAQQETTQPIVGSRGIWPFVRKVK